MKKILMPGMDPLSYGDRAAVKGTVEALRTLIPDVTLTILSPFPEITQGDCEKYGVQVVRMPWVRRTRKASLTGITNLYSGVLALWTLVNCSFYRIFKPLNIPIRGGLQQYDMYIELGADTHARYFGSLGFYYSLLPPLFFIIIGKPFIMFAETMGPYNGKLDRFLMRFICNRASLITLRDGASMGHLQELGLDNANVHVAGDPAYLFESQCPGEKAYEILANEGICREDQPLIGIAPNSLIYKYAFPNARGIERYKNYVMLMAKMTDYIVDKLGATVVLVPHTISAEWNDRRTSKDIYQAVRNKHGVRLVKDELTVDELKAVIGMCQMFIACRMHAAVASTSMHVPTIVTSFSHKYAALSSLLEPERCIVDIRNPDFDQLLSELCSRIDYVWENKEQISQTLRERMPEVREKASLSAKLIKELLDKSLKPSRE